MGATVSIVSHGHGLMVQGLLLQLARHCQHSVDKVVLTLNLPESEPTPPDGGWPFALKVCRQPRPLGFARNHNEAFLHCQSPYFCVLNPDIVLVLSVDGLNPNARTDPFNLLIQAASHSDVGLAYPKQTDTDGRVLDHVRRLPTPLSLLRRHLFGKNESGRVDWVSGAVMMFRSDVYRMLGGFNAAFHMYCEDVDLCLRARRRGLRLSAAGVEVIHDTQRASRRSLRHLRWHLASLLRLWTSKTFWWALSHR